MKNKKRVILKGEDISTIVQKIARQIIEKNRAMEDVLLIGIRTGGAFLAARLQDAIAGFGVISPPVGILDITLYRDDWTRIGPAPVVGKTDIPFSVDDKVVILVDDVLYTGRTVRAAMDAIMDYGRPKKIQLVILVDRGSNNRELPIVADYVGIVWDTAPEENINVYLKEGGFDDHVALEEKRRHDHVR